MGDGTLLCAMALASLAPDRATPPPEPAPTNLPLGRVAAFDGLRALLVAAVVVYHLDGGRLRSAIGESAVIVFFVLSGFLITTLLVEERRRTGHISIRAFYTRRARRLLPALGLLLVVWLAVALLLGHEPWLTSVPGGGAGAPISPYTALEGVGVAAGYLTNWLDALPGLHLWVGYVPLGHLWTLAVEEQFYLVWAPLALVLLRLRRATWVVGALTALAMAEPWLLWDEGTKRLYFGSDTRAGALMLGAFLALVWSSGHLRWLARRGVSAVLVGTGALGLVVAGFGFTGVAHEWSWVGGVTLAAMCGGTIVATLATRRDDKASRALSHPLMVWVGQRSYAIYLWGYVFNTWFRSLGFATAPVVVACTLIVAELSYRFVEAPVLRRGRARRSSQVHRLAGAGAS